jgi:hypothetical protein
MDGEKRNDMKYQTPTLQCAGTASSLILAKTVQPGEGTNPMYHVPGTITVLIEG